jgi:hypothetical protein
MTDDAARLRPSDWLPAIFDVTDVKRFLTSWVVPRLGADLWLEDVDTAGPPDYWLDVLDSRDIDELGDMVAVCKDVCGREAADFERILEDIRHGQCAQDWT